MSNTGRLAAGRTNKTPAASTSPGDDAQVGGEFLGREIRDLRKAKRMTLADLSKECGYSLSFLSQLERNKSRPSIKCLHDISRALGVNIGWFFGDTAPALIEERDYIVRGNRRRRLNFASGITDELLSPNLSGQLELLYSRFAPGATSGESPYSHRGEEAGLVLSGALELWIEDKCFNLQTGDSFSFPSSKPHRYSNPTEHEATVLWVMTPPSY